MLYYYTGTLIFGSAEAKLSRSKLHFRTPEALLKINVPTYYLFRLRTERRSMLMKNAVTIILRTYLNGRLGDESSV